MIIIIIGFVFCLRVARSKKSGCNLVAERTRLSDLPRRVRSWPRQIAATHEATIGYMKHEKADLLQYFRTTRTGLGYSFFYFLLLHSPSLQPSLSYRCTSRDSWYIAGNHTVKESPFSLFPPLAL